MNYPIQNMFDAHIREHLKEMYLIPINEGYVDIVTGDVCNGDEIAFIDAVFSGKFPSVRFSHFELITGKVISVNFSAKTNQYSFTIRTQRGKIIRREKSVYRYLTLARPRNSDERKKSLQEKYGKSGGIILRKVIDNWKFEEDL